MSLNEETFIKQFNLQVLSGVSVLFSFIKLVNSNQEQKEISLMKDRLSIPVYTLSENELKGNYPWLGNESEWKYRIIKVKGRPMHYQSMILSQKANQIKDGAVVILPLVLNEQKDENNLPTGKNKEGILMNYGFIPKRYQNVTDRFDQENVDEQEFIGYLSNLDQYNSICNGGNSYNQYYRNYWNRTDQKEMNAFSNFKNQEKMTLAIERVCPKSEMDEKSINDFKMTGSVNEYYPFIKNRTGALKFNKMPYELKKESGILFVGGLGLGALGLIL